jgi:hypothetical protein
MKRLLLAVFLLVPYSHSQCFAQGTRAGAAREANFLYEVKVIDEFIERFNDDPTSFLRKEYLRVGKEINFTRQDLLKYLFEKTVAPSDSLVMKFVSQVTDSVSPQKLNFNDSEWYAEVMCAFNAGGRRIEIPLVMQISEDTDKSVRWMISGIGDSPALQDPNASTAALKTTVKDQKQYISPSDYATNFLELHRILKPGFEGINYMTPQLLESERGKRFAQLVESGKMKFESSGHMRFYFFQIPNYTFTVERFVRQTTHSGWLISDLTSTTEDEKQARKAKLLQRTL